MRAYFFLWFSIVSLYLLEFYLWEFFNVWDESTFFQGEYVLPSARHLKTLQMGHLFIILSLQFWGPEPKPTWGLANDHRFSEEPFHLKLCPELTLSQSTSFLTIYHQTPPLCPIVPLLPNAFSPYLDKVLVMSGPTENYASSEPSPCHPLQN